MSNTNQADIKTCVTCKHHVQNDYFDRTCYKLAIKEVDVVTGQSTFRNVRECRKMREDNYSSCGPSGKLWEKR